MLRRHPSAVETPASSHKHSKNRKHEPLARNLPLLTRDVYCVVTQSRWLKPPALFTLPSHAKFAFFSPVLLVFAALRNRLLSCEGRLLSDTMPMLGVIVLDFLCRGRRFLCLGIERLLFPGSCSVFNARSKRSCKQR